MVSRRRGLTLVELLAALALLGVLMVGVSSWIGVVGRMTPRALETAQFRTAAEACFRRIHEDLHIGDFPPEREHSDSRIETDGSALRIQTRAEIDATPEMHIYEAVEETARLVRRSGSGHERVLLGGLSEVTFEVDEDETVLIVSLEAHSGERIERRFLLP